MHKVIGEEVVGAKSLEYKSGTVLDPSEVDQNESKLKETEGIKKDNQVDFRQDSTPALNIVDRLRCEERVELTVVSRLEYCRVFHLKVKRETMFNQVMRTVGMKLKRSTKKLFFSRDCDGSEISKQCNVSQLKASVVIVAYK